MERHPELSAGVYAFISTSNFIIHVHQLHCVTMLMSTTQAVTPLFRPRRADPRFHLWSQLHGWGASAVTLTSWVNIVTGIVLVRSSAWSDSSTVAWQLGAPMIVVAVAVLLLELYLTVKYPRPSTTVVVVAASSTRGSSVGAGSTKEDLPPVEAFDDLGQVAGPELSQSVGSTNGTAVHDPVSRQVSSRQAVVSG
jgi:hypothetical protein